MPQYEFKCDKCNKVTEVARPITESATPIKCEECGEDMHRIISLCEFSLQGSGWARDGYSGK